jgi:hypothetical protein
VHNIQSCRCCALWHLFIPPATDTALIQHVIPQPIVYFVMVLVRVVHIEVTALSDDRQPCVRAMVAQALRHCIILPGSRANRCRYIKLTWEYPCSRGLYDNYNLFYWCSSFFCLMHLKILAYISINRRNYHYVPQKLGLLNISKKHWPFSPYYACLCFKVKIPWYCITVPLAWHPFATH